MIEGFDELATIIERYNHPYYATHIEKMGYKKDADWFEYQLNIPAALPENIKRVSKYVLKKHKLRVVRIKKLTEIEKFADGVFKLLNDLYGLMYGFVPITPELKNFYIRKYLPLIDPKLMAFIVDEKDTLVAFGVTMPSYSELFKQAKGSWLRLLWLKFTGQAVKTDTVDMYFIGVLPEYINHGLSSVLINTVGQTLIDLGYKKAETNIEFESNEAVQSLWKHFDYRQHKRRRCYLKSFISSSRTEDNI
jgi:ribosomal protein S18 acetylase RimI-like enzyme